MSSISVTATVRDSSGNAGNATVSATINDATPVVVGASSFKPGSTNRLSSAQNLDTSLAQAAGLQKPVMRFWHTYDSDIPPTFAQSSAAQAPANGWGSLLNIRATPGYIRTTAGRNALIAFLTSVPASLWVLYLIWAHEPENDNMSLAAQEAWRLDMAEFVKIVLDFGNAKIIPCSCFMGDPPVSWDNFDFTPLLRPGDQDRMYFLFDAYPKCRTGPDRTDDPGFKYDTVANWARAKGFKNLGVGETTLNNDLMVAQALVDYWWSVKLPNWLAANPDVKILAVYDSTGPAAGTNGLINTQGELIAVANLMRP